MTQAKSEHSLFVSCSRFGGERGWAVPNRLRGSNKTPCTESVVKGRRV